ncbi:hypothetical protein E4T42_07156 [Aureobasidium subglaciale]|nr:hypothetical protein E4T42_07156 [Aureobasidium subglaciale]
MSTSISQSNLPPTTALTIMPPRKVPPHRRYAKKFLTLPNELLIKLSDCVAPEDLPNFRLTCKKLENISGKHFGDKRLAHCRFIFTQYSMEGLVEMTAHPVIGPCVKSVLFGTHRLSNALDDLLDAIKSNPGISDDGKAMDTIHQYRERRDRQDLFRRSDLSRMVIQALTHLRSWGNSVALGILDDVYQICRGKSLLRGYGFAEEYDILPFVELAEARMLTVNLIRGFSRDANIHASILVLDLSGQENRVEFSQRAVTNQSSSLAEQCRFNLLSVGGYFRHALLSAPLRQLNIKSCSTYGEELVGMLRALSETLQVVEMVDAAIWGDQDPHRNMWPVICSLRDDLKLQTLVLDDVRAMNKGYEDPPGVLVVRRRFWHGPQKIRSRLDVLADFECDGWDCENLHDWYEETIAHLELEVRQLDLDYSAYALNMSYEEYQDHKASEDIDLQGLESKYSEYKARRAQAKEAMTRVEAL